MFATDDQFGMMRQKQSKQERGKDRIEHIGVWN
jgi:hypothetical protein